MILVPAIQLYEITENLDVYVETCLGLSED
jgi:hypothetical protein